jgi:type IV secretion system protein TrbG
MRHTLRTLAYSVMTLGVVSCASHDVYPPALPAARIAWDNAPLVAVTPPPPDLMPVVRPPPPEPPPGLRMAPLDWDLWRPAAVPCKGRKCPKASGLSPVEQATVGALVKPTRGNTAGGTSAIVTYPVRPGSANIYQVETAVASPTYLLLPAGERLAAPPAVNPDAWAVGLVQMGKDTTRQETVVIRPLLAPQEATTALLFQSGLILFCKLIATEKTGMLSVTWDVSPAVASLPIPELPVIQRPPKMNLERLFTGYTTTVQGKYPPPWLPSSVFDDGTRTFLRIPAENLQGTRAPAVFGITQAGTTALVQSHLYVSPDQKDAAVLVQGLWPALLMKDSAGLAVKIVRQTPPGPVQEVRHGH